MSDHCTKSNILWIVDHLGYNGFLHGAGTYYLNTIPLINKDKYSITLCVLRKRDNLAKCFEEKGIRIDHLGRSKYDPMTLVDVLKKIKSESIDLIHAHGYGAANFGRIAGGIARIPTIVHAHDDDRAYPTSQKLADYLLSHFTHKAIAVSESVKESCIAKRNICADRIQVLHNGISLEYFSVPVAERIEKERDRLRIESDRRVVGTVTRLREEKGLRYFIESAQHVLSKFPETIFLIVGDGPLKEELCNLTVSLAIRDQVIFAGYCSDIPAILSIMDIVVIPSLTEGCPSALLEAMAIGKPIIATNVGGIKEIMKDGTTGLFIPAKDPNAQAKQIICLMQNRSLADRLGRRAKEESQKYDIRLHVRRLESYYKQLISSAQTTHGNIKESLEGPSQHRSES